MTNIVEGLLPLAVRIDTVRPNPKNPRNGDVPAAMRSLAAFGQRKPITADAAGLITAGHHVHAAAVQLGWDQIAVVFCDDDETTAKAWALADNRTSDLGRYDTDLLAEQMRDVAEKDFDLLTAASYSQDDLDALLAISIGPPGGTPDDDGFDDSHEDDNRSGGKVCPNCGHVLS